MGMIKIIAVAALLLMAEAASAAESLVYIARRGWHIDVGFQASDLAPPLNGIAANFPGASGLFFGFGDRRYLDSRRNGAPFLLAALWPGRGLILTTALSVAPPDAFGAAHVVALKVSAAEARAIQAFIWDSILGHDPYRMGPYPDSLYFTATPTYSGFYTCNTWAAQALATGGLPIRTTGTVFASQLWRQVRRVQQKQSTVAPSTIDAQPELSSAPEAVAAPGAVTR